MTAAMIGNEIITTHRLIQGDAREMPDIKDESVHLVVTSPPYWILKRYNNNAANLDISQITNLS